MHSEENTSIKENRKSIPCLNCDTTLTTDATHCHRCGQAIKEARMTVRTLFAELFTNLFNLDGKIWKTLRNMWKPAFLTKEYVSGKRKTYFNPARFFAINLILHFILMTYSMSHSDIGLDNMDDVASITKSELVTQYDTIAASLIPAADSVEIDTLRKALFGNTRHVNEDTMFASVQLFTDIGEYGILKKDAYSMNSEDLFEKYEITGWWDRLFIGQTIRINKNRESTLAFIIGNLTWVVIFVLFFVALVLKLLYVRGGYYYVEHAVLMMLLHAKVFLVLNVIMLIGNTIPYIEEELIATIIASIYGLSALYLLITMKIYYQQGWFKTLIKYWLVGMAYLISLFFFLLLVSIVGAAIF